MKIIEHFFFLKIRISKSQEIFCEKLLKIKKFPFASSGGPWHGMVLLSCKQCNIVQYVDLELVIIKRTYCLFVCLFICLFVQGKKKPQSFIIIECLGDLGTVRLFGFFLVSLSQNIQDPSVLCLEIFCIPYSLTFYLLVHRNA